MKQLMWALVVIGLLLFGAAGPPEVAAGGPGGGSRGGGTGWTGGGYRGGAPGWGGGYRGPGPGWGGAYRVGGPYPYRYGYGGTRVFIGGGVGWWGGPGWGGYPGWWGGAAYPYYYGGQPVVVQPAPTEYIQQGPAPPQQAYWYYCQHAGAYYPYVKDCPGGWMQVVPSPNPPAQ